MDSGIGRALLGSKLRVGMIGVLVVTGAVGGGLMMGVLGAPAVSDVSNHFGTVSAESTTIHTDLAVTNPNPIGLGLGDVTVAYAVDLNDVRIATGEKEGIDVAAGNSTIELDTEMRNGKIPAWWVAHLRNGEHSELVVHATVTSSSVNESFEAPEIREDVDTDIASAFNSTERRPIEADEEPLVQDPVLYVEETRGWWGSVTDEETTIQMRFAVTNPKPYAIPIQEVGYDLGMNGIDVGSGSTDRSYVIPPGETRTVTAELTLRNDRLDEWWVSHLERDQVTDLTVDLSLVVDLSNVPGGGPTVTVPVDTIEHEIETDVFGNKAEYPTGGAAGSPEGGDRDPTATGSPTESAVDGDSEGDDTSTTTGTSAETSTETPTPTGTPTPAETPTPTTTDGGLLDGLADPSRGLADE